MNTKIIAAIDNSAAARPVLASALALAGVLGASVEAIHVNDDGGGTAQASAESFGVPFRTAAGNPFDILVEMSARDDVVAVAVGARGRPGGARPAGHLALALADSIDKPVLVVPPDAQPSGSVQRVVLAMEGTPAKARSAKRTVEVAAGAGLELIVVHVDDENSIPLFSDQVQHETEAYAREFLARYCHGAPEARLELRIGIPADEIMAAVDKATPDILAIGWPHSSEPGRGGVARQILDRSHTPVLLVAVT
jgi:nucleotide-binding universal stress UspA family protein